MKVHCHRLSCYMNEEHLEWIISCATNHLGLQAVINHFTPFVGES